MITAKSLAKNYQTELSGASAQTCIDVPKAKGGTGNGLQPFEMLLGGFAGCLSITLRMLLDKKQIKYRAVKVTADEDRTAEPGTMIISFKVELDADISEEEKAECIKRAFDKCPVHNALKGNIEFRH